MTPRHKKRLALILFILLGMSATVALTVNAFRETILFFLSPSDIAQKKSSHNRQVRMGGMVKEGSIQRADGLLWTFEVTDFNHSVAVQYEGILPDLFREKQGVVVRGQMQNKIFIADEVLAKHDENYMPVEVQNALDAARTLQVD